MKWLRTHPWVTTGTHPDYGPREVRFKTKTAAEKKAWEWTSLGYTATVWCSPGRPPLGDPFAKECGVWTPDNRALMRRRYLKETKGAR